MWLKKCFSSNLFIDFGNYNQKVLDHFYDIKEKSDRRKAELLNYTADLASIQKNLEYIGYPNALQAIEILKGDDYFPIYQIYKNLGDMSYKMDYRDPKREIIEEIRNEIRKISDKKDEYSLSDTDVQELIKNTISKTNKNMNEIKNVISQAVSRTEWNGSRIIIKVGSPPSYSINFSPSYSDPVDSAEIVVGKKTEWGGSPSFTFFGDFDERGSLVKYDIDDILEGGDEDFFSDSKTQEDYFNLVSELKNPGRSQRERDQSVVLYTARPIKDRNLLMESQTIPPNIFLTNSYSNAEGLSVDFGGRDIWKVKIKKKYIIQTLDSPEVKWFQVKYQDKPVPVDYIRLISPGD